VLYRGYWNTKVLNPLTGKFEIHGSGLSVLLGGQLCEKIHPTDRQLRKIRNDIDKYLKHKEQLKTVYDDI
jgi:hypothetical protein